MARVLMGGMVLAVMGAGAQAPPPAPVPLISPQPGYSYPAHLTLNYAVDWRVFPAGTSSFHLEQQGDEERVTATGETLGAINLIYRVVDHFQSSFNRRTGCSAGFAKQLQEGHRQVSTDLKFDYAQRKAILNEKNLVKGTSKHQETPVGPCVTDLLSAIFYPASQNLVPGQSFRVPVADAMHTVTVTMKVEARETVKTPLGTYPTIRVQPTAEAGTVKARGNIWVWYTDDARHIPVQMRARLFWGTITFRLTSMEPR
ncbi:MAG TPA: DUF3108 domain-containing protein [Acidobacteriaceae bacterium]|jgi:hypothetical protein|nr:DUF3108 domain-containing protein [Acidobacteriaceae bacterium]